MIVGREADSIQSRAPTVAKSSAGPSVSVVAAVITVCGKTSAARRAAHQTENCHNEQRVSPKRTPAYEIGNVHRAAFHEADESRGHP